MLLEVLTDILGVVKGSLDSEQELIPVGRTWAILPAGSWAKPVIWPLRLAGL